MIPFLEIFHNLGHNIPELNLLMETGKTHGLTALLVDDELPALDHLEALLLHLGHIRIAGRTTRPEEVTALVSSLHPDLVFLDIQMPGKNGIDVLKEIAAMGLTCPVVMVTAFSNFMLEAFRNAAFDYLIKPVDLLELENVILRFRENKIKAIGQERIEALQQYMKRIIRIPSVYETYFFEPDQIVCFEGDGKYTVIFQSNGTKLTTSINLGALEQLLPAGRFCRISKSHIINLSYLNRTDHRKKRCFLSAPGHEAGIPYSRVYIKNLDPSF